jgi:UDP-2,3-diacylglucosamine hydrolase
MKDNKKIYFLSDIHLGLPNYEESLKREKYLIKWLDDIKEQVAELYLLGDIFDFWHEWKTVVPRGYTRFFGKIAEYSDSGIKVHLFTGNHDIWMYDYLQQEIGVILHRGKYSIEISGKKFFMAHGDGLGPGDLQFKVMKRFFTNRIAQWLFARIHPNFSMWFGSTWSKTRRLNRSYREYLGPKKEWLMIYAREVLETKHYDYFIFGHRHIPIDYELNKKSRYINLGDWINHFTYAVFNGSELELKSHKPEVDS